MLCPCDAELSVVPKAGDDVVRAISAGDVISIVSHCRSFLNSSVVDTLLTPSKRCYAHVVLRTRVIFAPT